MKLATQVRYGTRILLDLAMHQGSGMVQMGDIASRQKISLKYLEQLIIPLKNAGFVKSKRGPHGGHCLVKNLRQITLAQIIRIFEKEKKPKESVSEVSSYSEYQDSLIKSAWAEAIEEFYSRLDRVTLADLSIDTTKELWKNSDLLILS